MKLKQIISQPRTQRSAAFTLVEATVSLGILGSVVVALFSGFTTGFFTMQLARENLRATQIMLEKMETIRLYNWDQVNTPGFIPASFTAPYDPNARDGQQGVLYRGTMIITNAPIGASYSGDMRMVIVNLQWTTGYLPRSREFTSYISRHGLQDYIY
jgi:type II secretory pathway pseudopilin PulG